MADLQHFLEGLLSVLLLLDKLTTLYGSFGGTVGGAAIAVCFISIPLNFYLINRLQKAKKKLAGDETKSERIFRQQRSAKYRQKVEALRQELAETRSRHANVLRALRRTERKLEETERESLSILSWFKSR